MVLKLADFYQTATDYILGRANKRFGIIERLLDKITIFSGKEILGFYEDKYCAYTLQIKLWGALIGDLGPPNLASSSASKIKAPFRGGLISFTAIIRNIFPKNQCPQEGPPRA